MLPGNQRFKYLLVLLAAQIGCIGLGLWFHYHFAVSALYRAVEETALADLAADTDELLAATSRLELMSHVSGSAGLEQVERLFQTKQLAPGVQLTLVDSQWQILSTLPASAADSPPGESAGQPLVWTAPPDSAGSDADRITGSLVMPEGNHVAIAYRLNGGEGYAVVHCPLERVKVAPAALLSFLPAVGVITWMWTSALLVITVYLIVTRFCQALTKSLARTETAALKGIYSLLRTRDSVIFGLAKLSESRDDTTGHHLERIATYASRLAATVHRHPKYCDEVTPKFIELIEISSALHDIGKVGIEDSILLKPGPLTECERTRIQEHATIGGKCLLEIERHLGSCNYLQMARGIAPSHHERWDGTGYPQGLAGEEIPLAARIVAIADVYDALSTRRPYKEAMQHKDCVALIHDGAGTQFDPDLVEAFLKIEGWFRRVARQYGQGPSGSAKPVPDAPVPSAAWERESLARLEVVLKEHPPGSTSLPNFG